VKIGDKVRLSPKFKQALCRQQHTIYFFDSRRHLSKFKDSVGRVVAISVNYNDIAVEWEVPYSNDGRDSRAYYKIGLNALVLVP
jgi:hypothetical protein